MDIWKKKGKLQLLETSFKLTFLGTNFCPSTESTWITYGFDKSCPCARISHHNFDRILLSQRNLQVKYMWVKLHLNTAHSNLITLHNYSHCTQRQIVSMPWAQGISFETTSKLPSWNCYKIIILVHVSTAYSMRYDCKVWRTL